MGDLLIDFRPKEDRRAWTQGSFLTFRSCVRCHRIATRDFDALVTIPVGDELWAPFSNPSADRTIALAGRVILDDALLALGDAVPGPGGTVCKALDSLYRAGGIERLLGLSGNFVIIVHDGRTNETHVITDCAGTMPMFEYSNGSYWVAGSHPDALAEITDQSSAIDLVSIAEFALTGTVSHPYTFYRNIRALGRASLTTLRSSPGKPPNRETKCHFPLEYLGPEGSDVGELAEQLAEAFRHSVSQRTNPRYGTAAIALSGGLDSRAVLASIHPSARAFAFTCFDRCNLELKTAQAIARAAGVEFHPFQRSAEYYGENADEGMKVGGGMGTFANNHFLGAISWLRDLGADNLLTGCYCDYLFKGLPLNRRTKLLSGVEYLAPFDPEFYFTHYWPDTNLATAAKERVRSRCPSGIAGRTDEASVFLLEVARTFPLSYEGDNAQRLIPQRLIGWIPPISDPALLRLFCRIPYNWKLNRCIFTRVVGILCGSPFKGIPDANTGAPVGAPTWRTAAGEHLLRARRLLRRISGRISPQQGSWPDWKAYIARSRLVRDLWGKPHDGSARIIAEILGTTRLPERLDELRDADLHLMIQVLSLKLWFARREC